MPHTTSRLRFGFTYVDLLVVLLIVCLMAAYAFAAGGIMKARETSNRTKCAQNLRQIGQALQLYSNENKGAYPRTVYAAGEAVTQYTGVECKDPFKKEGAPKANDVTAAMFLLVRTQDLPVQSFVCPATDAGPVPYGNINALQGMANFKSEENLSYSMNDPYFSKEGVGAGAKWNGTLGADFVTVGDMNPGKLDPADVTKPDVTSNAGEQRRANSLNHRQDGQNVLYGDGHVEFQTNAFVGVRRDNVYTVAGARDGSRATSTTVEGSPAWAGDSVLLPVATANPHKKTPAEEEAAAAEGLRKDLPAMKSQIAAMERRTGPTAQVARMKANVADLERELAEYEARRKK